MHAILNATPGSRGILFDLPHVLLDVPGSDRMEVCAGDFFKDPLPQANAYVLSEVLHDWSDERAVEILCAVRASAREGAHVLVLEVVLPENPGPHPAHVLDVIMLALTGGRERTRADHEALLRAGGFRLERIVPTYNPVSVVVGVAV